MTAFMVAALTPLWMGIIAVLVGLPVGLRYAKKEKAARLATEDQEGKSQAAQHQAATRVVSGVNK
jgi:H+/gluconate symporter-like permease